MSRYFASVTAFFLVPAVASILASLIVLYATGAEAFAGMAIVQLMSALVYTALHSSVFEPVVARMDLSSEGIAKVYCKLLRNGVFASLLFGIVGLVLYGLFSKWWILACALGVLQACDAGNRRLAVASAPGLMAIAVDVLWFITSVSLYLYLADRMPALNGAIVLAVFFLVGNTARVMFASRIEDSTKRVPKLNSRRLKPMTKLALMNLWNRSATVALGPGLLLFISPFMAEATIAVLRLSRSLLSFIRPMEDALLRSAPIMISKGGHREWFKSTHMLSLLFRSKEGLTAIGAISIFYVVTGLCLPYAMGTLTNGEIFISSALGLLVFPIFLASVERWLSLYLRLRNDLLPINFVLTFVAAIVFIMVSEVYTPVTVVGYVAIITLARSFVLVCSVTLHLNTMN